MFQLLDHSKPIILLIGNIFVGDDVGISISLRTYVQCVHAQHTHTHIQKSVVIFNKSDEHRRTEQNE